MRYPKNKARPRSSRVRVWAGLGGQFFGWKVWVESKFCFRGAILGWKPWVEWKFCFYDFWGDCVDAVKHSKTCKRPKASPDFMKREEEDSLSVRLCTSRVGGEALGRIEVLCFRWWSEEWKKQKHWFYLGRTEVVRREKKRWGVWVVLKVWF